MDIVGGFGCADVGIYRTDDCEAWDGERSVGVCLQGEDVGVQSLPWWGGGAADACAR